MGTGIDPTDPTPAYLQIAGDLRAAIAEGRYSDQAPLPSIAELRRQYGTSDGPVKQAIRQLVNEGLVVTRKGRGAFVRKPRRLQRFGSRRHLPGTKAGKAPLEAEAEQQTMRRDQQVLSVDRIPAPAEIAERLGIDPGTQVLVRRHLLSLDGTPAQLADSHFPLDLVEDTLIAAPAAAGPITGGVHAALSALGLELDHFREEWVARMPMPYETRALRLAAGTPVLRLLRTLYATDGRPLEVSDFRLAGDLHQLVYDVPAR